MSWIFGVAGEHTDDCIQKVKQICPDPLHAFQSDRLFIQSGGLSDTCYADISSNSQSGWTVCGLGIQYNNENTRVMNPKNWEDELIKNSFDPYALNGHFALIRWNPSELRIYTDQLGVRNIYLTIRKNQLVFSTRIDWLAQYCGNTSIDWEQFGAAWLLGKYLSDQCFLKDMNRISHGGKAVFHFTSSKLTVENSPWHPDLVRTESEENETSVLRNLCLCGLSSSKKISLSLSGGLDSRVLLAVLMASGEKNWCLHSFCHADHPDRIIASQISRHFGIEHIIIEQDIPDSDKCISILKDYIGQTHLTVHAAGFLHLQFYSLLHQQGKLVIDGAFGELARRRILVSLFLRGEKALLNYDIKKIIRLLKFHRASIFNQGYVNTMESGCEQQLTDVLKTMPDIRHTGIENWLDLFAVRTHLLNYAGPEQSRSDCELQNYMPFIQPVFLRKIFDLSVSQRKNGRFFRKIIRENKRELSRYPLVKDGIYYPYKLSTIQASLWTQFKRKLGLSYTDQTEQVFLNRLSGYIQDLVLSREIKECEFYNYSRILSLVQNYYQKNNLNCARELNWWLTFEIWRQVMNIR